MKRVIITDYFNNPDIEQHVFGDQVEVICLNEENEKNFPNTINDADAILVWHAILTEKTFKKIKNCKTIVRYGVGIDNVDFISARNFGINFANTPDYGIHEVADTTCSMITALSRKIFLYNSKCKNYSKGWQENVLNPIKRSTEHNLGIIGAGRIGSAVALRMKAFGMNVAIYDPYVSNGYEKTLGVTRFESLNDILKYSSIISIHAHPLNKETKGMVNEDFVNHMNDATIFINTARGKIVDKLDTLYNGLMSGKLDSVGLDVLPDEPPLNTEKLITAWKDTSNPISSRIIITPHTAFYTPSSWKEMRIKAAQNINRVFKGLKLKNLIN